MNTSTDYINVFQIKNCKNDFDCYFLKNNRCKFKHNYVNAKTNDEHSYNKCVQKSNSFAIKNWLSNDYNLKIMSDLYKNIQNNLNQSQSLKAKEIFLNAKEKSLELQRKDLEEVKNKNDTAFLERIQILSTKYKRSQIIIDEKTITLNTKIITANNIIKEYNNNLDTYQCEKFKHFDKKKLDNVLDDSVCDVCLTPISDVKGIDSVMNILECGHSFCYSCITILTKNETYIKCPTCRNEYHIDTIKRNIALEKIIDVIKKIKN